MKAFIDFCKGIASDVDITTMVEDQDNLPNNEKINPIIKESADMIILELQYKIPRVNSLTLGYIQNAFEDLDEVEELLEDTWNSDIPIGLSCYISEALYKKKLKDLTDDEASIIKVLTIYSMIL
jgi:hypothetical protein